MTEPENPADPSAPAPPDQVDTSLVEDDEPDAPRSQGAAPPPLPAFAPQPQAPAAPPDVAPVAKRSAGKTLGYGVLVVALLAGAAIAGLWFGDLVRGKPAASATVVEPSAPSVAAAAPTSPPPSPSPSATTVTLPAVEIH